MGAEKNNNKKEKTVDDCCAGMTEMMGKCCPNGPIDSDCYTWMKEMGKFCSPGRNEPANREKKGS